MLNVSLTIKKYVDIKLKQPEIESYLHIHTGNVVI